MFACSVSSSSYTSIGMLRHAVRTGILTPSCNTPDEDLPGQGTPGWSWEEPIAPLARQVQHAHDGRRALGLLGGKDAHLSCQPRFHL